MISLLPKPGRNPSFLKGRRSICLLCADYKLLAKTIALRFKTYLDKLIHRDQSGFLKGSNICNNLRKVLDTVTYVAKHKVDGLLISIDFEKAFDFVEHKAVYKAMELFNFGQNMIQWMKVLFCDISSCTQNNGYTSKHFQPTRALFQGNSINSNGFLIIIKILVILL